MRGNVEPEEYRTNFLLEDSYWWFVGRRRIVERALRSWAGESVSGRILDAGCGTGRMLEFLGQLGESSGVELHGEGLRYCRERKLPRLVQGSIARLPFRSGAFSLVSCFDVLYHREVDERKALDEVYRVSAPGGYLIITDAAYPFLQSEHDESVHGARRYTKRSLRTTVERAGFRIVKISYWNFFLFPAVVCIRFLKNLLPRRRKRPVSDLKPLPGPINALLTGIVFVEAFAMRIASLPFGTSIVLLARKP